MKKIIIPYHKASESLCGHVRLAPDAERVVRELCRESGLSARHIASQIIIQGAEFVVFEEADKE